MFKQIINLLISINAHLDQLRKVQGKILATSEKLLSCTTRLMRAHDEGLPE